LLFYTVSFDSIFRECQRHLRNMLQDSIKF
jgi:hypothetical protein